MQLFKAAIGRFGYQTASLILKVYVAFRTVVKVSHMLTTCP